MSSQLYARLVTTVRLLMGVDLLVNGLNWWVKLITPYPSISDFTNGPLPHDFVGAMIGTGFLFHIVKGVELVAGLALLANRFVPLALVAVFAISVNVFLVDVVLAQRLRACVMGSGELLMNVALILAYLNHYRPMLQVTASPDVDGARPVVPADSMFLRTLVAARPAVLVVAALNGIVIIVWVVVMIAQRALGSV